MSFVRRFRDLSMKFQLIVFFLVVGTIPLAVTAWLSYSKADRALSEAKDQASNSIEKQTFAQLTAIRDVKREQVERYFTQCQADLGALVETVATLREEALKKLVAVREVKRQAVARYFQTINDQAITFSEDKMIVEAMRQFRDSFQGVRAENKIATEDMAEVRKEVCSYYTDQFAKEYMNRNGGQAPEVDSIIDKLDDDSIALQYYYIQKNDKPLGSKHLLDRADDGSEYSEIHGRIHPIVRSFLEKFGYYDIFLVDSRSGDIVYSVFKELDFSTSLLDGPYADTNFGEAFRLANAAIDKDAVVLVDYARYTPSYEAAASFVACPIFDGDEKIGVAMFQMPIDRLNAIMSERAGLGQTGETYLVGPDGLMRSDSYLDSKNHSVAASFANPKTGKVDTEATKSGLAGQTGANVITDYNGHPVLSAYAPISMGRTTWAIVAEIDVAEAFCPRIEGAEKDFFTHYKEQCGYYDLFLINPDGYCFYSVCREPDYQTNLVAGKYRDSNLGKLVRHVLQTRQFDFADFEPYAPSNGDPAAFVAQPVVDGEQLQAVVALQLPMDTVNTIMGVRAGMGETGETYLIGPDKRMRSDSFLDPEGHSVRASFAGTIEKNGVDTEAAREALAGNADAKIITDYNGNPVLSAYTPIKLFDTTWALLAEIDEAEAFAPILEMQATADKKRTDLQWNAWLIAVLALAAIAVVAYWVSGLITKPVKKVVGLLDMVAGGNYTQKAEVSTKDEIGRMAGSLNVAIDAVAKAMQDVKDAAEREKKAQEERAEQARLAAEAEQKRKDAEAQREREAAEAELKRQAEAAEKERQLAAEEARKVEVLRNKVNNLLVVVNSAADGDLTRKVTVEGDEAIDELAAGIKRMLEDLSGIISQVTESAVQFNEGSRVIAESSQTLASGAQTQSASVEEMSASIEELTASIDGVKNNALEADTVAKRTNDLAERGGMAVQKSIEAMELIRTSSDQIAEIIQVISEIASQTNLLALNAAIEAARAGEHGMGFAVVADEVRKLAERSNKAAGEITGLIRESGNRVQEGAQLSDETGVALKEIIDGVQATVTKISEIATATVEQASNAMQVGQAIQGIAEVTEQAAAGSEEMASSSEELGAQASTLRDLVARFKTSNTDDV